jgi:hypothetical protein
MSAMTSQLNAHMIESRRAEAQARSAVRLAAAEYRLSQRAARAAEPRSRRAAALRLRPGRLLSSLVARQA